MRENPNDIFLTPLSVALDHINQVEEILQHNTGAEFVWVDPFRGPLGKKGVYYDNFVSEDREWCEITQGRDAYHHNYNGKVVCSNPPFSHITALLKLMADGGAYCISLLIGQMNVNPNRFKLMERKGYKLVHQSMRQVKGDNGSWYGPSCFVTWIRRTADNEDPQSPFLEGNSTYDFS